ncbi:hypothetical protein [Geminicoccus harenae]|uniref:hypothetical protein n=1 Tax=Geminicoccus harenae TaxID=2498453 RepID=UPI00168BE335|nr:hypothetical protein [Geminicoccus harenae]
MPFDAREYQDALQKDDVFTFKQAARLAEIRRREESEKQEAATAALRKKNERDIHRLQGGLIGMLVTSLFFLLIVVLAKAARS